MRCSDGYNAQSSGSSQYSLLGSEAFPGLAIVVCRWLASNPGMDHVSGDCTPLTNGCGARSCIWRVRSVGTIRNHDLIPAEFASALAKSIQAVLSIVTGCRALHEKVGRSWLDAGGNYDALHAVSNCQRWTRGGAADKQEPGNHSSDPHHLESRPFGGEQHAILRVVHALLPSTSNATKHP